MKKFPFSGYAFCRIVLGMSKTMLDSFPVCSEYVDCFNVTIRENGTFRAGIGFTPDNWS